MQGLLTQQDWQHEVRDLIRGASGGFLFGIPLLYTMEAWWIGSYTEPPTLLMILGVTFIILFFLNRTDGFRQLKPDSPIQALMDSTEALAIGIICATVILILIREITFTTPLREGLGKVIIEMVPFAIGVALARSILAAGDEESEDSSTTHSTVQKTHRVSYNATLADIGATLVGATIIAFNIAPTDEVPMLTAAISPLWLVGIICASILISYCIVFVAGLTTQQKRQQQKGLFQHPITETLVSYLISLLAAALMLWFFHRLGWSDPWTSWLRQVLVLGLPATIGGAAGRLAV